MTANCQEAPKGKVMKKFMASALSSALILLSPGRACYEAVAGNMETSGSGVGKSGPSANPQGNAPLSLPPSAIPAGAGLGGLDLSAGAGAAQGAAPIAAAVPGAALSGQPAAASAGPAATPAGPAAGPAAGSAAPAAPGVASASFSKPGQGSAKPTAAKPSAAAKDSQGAAAEKPSAARSEDSAQEAAAEATRQLADPGKDKGTVLSWLFDRLRRKSAQSLDENVPGGRESGRRGGLTAPTPRGAAKPGRVPAPQAGSAAKSDGTFRERLAAKFSLKEFNSTERAYILGQSLFMLAASIYIVSMPLLVKALTGDTANTGVIRMIHFWTLGFGSLFAGEIVSRLPIKRVLIGAGIGRAVIFGAVGGLALGGLLPWGLLAGLVGLNAMLVAHNHLADIDAAGANKIFSSAEKRKQGLRVFKTVKYGILLVMPWILGLGMDRLDSIFGYGTGPKAGFLAFAALMSVTVWIYATRLQLVAQTAIASAAQMTASLWARAWGIVKDAAKLIVETPRRNLRTAKLIWGNKTVTIRTGMATVEQFLEDALFMVVLPTFAIDVLGAGNLGNGLVLSSMYLGGMITSMLLARRAPQLEKKLGSYRFIRLLSVGAALAVVPSIALWIAPSIWVTLPIVALMKFMLDPIQTQMQSLLQEAIAQDPKTKPEEDNIFGLMTMLEMIAAGAGGLAFSWLFKHSGPDGFMTALLGANAPMKVVTGMLGIFSIVYLGFLPLVKRQLSKPVFKVHQSKPGQEAEAYAKLSANLKRMGLPPYKTAVSDAPAGSRPTVAILAPGSIYKISIAREGGRQSPGDVNLALDPSWITQAVGHDGKNKLLLTKGVVFDKDGQATVVEYRNPQPVRYFANFYTLGANGRDDGVPLEKDADVPMSNSEQLEHVTNDKLVTRLLLAAKGVAVPATVALLLSAHPLNNAQGASLSGPAQHVRAVSMPQDRAQVKAEIEKFLASYNGPEVVVKPSGPQFHSAVGVDFFKRGQVDAMVDHVLALRANTQMSADGAVLVEERLMPPALYVRTGKYEGHGLFAFIGERLGLKILGRGEIASAGPKERKDWNMRVLAARTPDGGAATSGIFVRAGTWGLPTNAEPADMADAAAVIKLDDAISALREQHGLLKTDAEAAEFRADLERVGAEALKAIAANEARRARGDGEPLQAQTDYIGLDVIVVLENGKLIPKIIEVNDHDAGGQWQLDQFDPANAGAHSREWIATALARASRDMLKGKRLVIVGAGYPNKKIFLEAAQRAGVEVVLVDKGLSGLARAWDWIRVKFGRPSRDNWARGLVKEFINVDTSNPRAVASASAAIRQSIRKKGPVDGITSYWEDDVLETARLAEALGLRYHPVKAVEIARSKHATREALRAAGVRTPKSWIIKSRAELVAALQDGFPPKAILKPEEGAEAQFTEDVTRENALAVYDRLQAEIAKSDDNVFKHSRSFVLDTYLDGPETDVNIVLQGGRSLSATLTDNWPTHPGSKKATGSSLPSRVLTAERQQHDKDLAVEALLKLGFTDGVFHVELKGGDILEINVRPGGSYTMAWDQAVYGVDEAEMLLMTAAGVPAYPFVPRKPNTHLEGAFLFSPQAGRVKKIGLTAEAKRLGISILIEKKPGSVVTKAENRLAFVYADGKTNQEALAKLGSDPSRLLEIEIDPR